MLIHAIVWIALFSLPFLLRPDKHDYTLRDILSYAAGNAVWVIFFYCNALLFIPRLLNKNLYGRYIAMLLCAYLFILVIQAVLFYYKSGEVQRLQLRTHLILIFIPVFAASSLAYRLLLINPQIVLQKTGKMKILNRIIAVALTGKSHFMFTRNNMVALARKNLILEPS